MLYLQSEQAELLDYDTEGSDRQFWRERERDAICATTDKLVDDALDNEDDRDRLHQGYPINEFAVAIVVFNTDAVEQDVLPAGEPAAAGLAHLRPQCLFR